MRTCKKCFKPKEESEFGVNNAYPDRKAIYCKSCNREHVAKMRANARILLTTTRVKVGALLGYKYRRIEANRMD